MKRFFISIFLLACFSLPLSHAQINRTTKTKIADMLAQMPVKKHSREVKLMKELLELQASDNVLPGLFSKLSADQLEKDLAVRYTLKSLSAYASGSSIQENDRRALSEAFVLAIKNEENTEIQSFLIRQLRFFAKQEATAPLAAYLSDSRLYFDAAMALVHIHTPEALNEVEQAAKTSKGKTQESLIEMLAGTGHSCDVDWLLSMKSSNPGLQKVRLHALAVTGNAKAFPALANAAKEVSFKFEKTNAAGSLETYAKVLARQGKDALAKKTLKLLLKQKKADVLHLRAAAMGAYAQYYGQEILPELIKDIDHRDFEHRGSVRAFLAKMKGGEVSKKLLKALERSNGKVKEEIIHLLGIRRDQNAVGPLMRIVKSKNGKQQQAALVALGRIQKHDVFPTCAYLLKNGEEPVMKEVAKVLKTYATNEQIDQLAGEFNQYPNAAQPSLVQIISEKRNEKHAPLLLAQLKSSKPELKNAAQKYLSRVVRAQDAQPLISALLAADQDNEISNLQHALVASCKKHPKCKQSDCVIEALQNTDHKSRLLAVLPEIGEKKGLKTLQKHLDNADPNISSTAHQALLSWPGTEAIPFIFHVLKSDQKSYQNKAFSGCLSLIQHPSVNNTQRLLLTRKLYAFAQNAEQRKAAVRSLAYVQHINSLAFLESLFDQPEVQQVAVLAAMKVALPKQGNSTGLQGEYVHQVLQKVTSLMDHPEGKYYKQSIRNYVAKDSKNEGFYPLFNGKTLEGWQGFTTDPVKKTKLSKEKLALMQAKANERMKQHWSAKNGLIRFKGKGENLCTVKEYKDFELYVDWKIGKEGDSGIYLRGSPQVQIWDTSRKTWGASYGSGGLYNNTGKENRSPLKKADNPIGDWNTFYIKMKDEIVTVYLNGELVVDHMKMENYWDRSQPIFPAGPIELQAHGTDIAFRNIFIHEIKDNEYQLTEEGKKAGFVSLFNGKDLDNWQGDKNSYKVKDNLLCVVPTKGHGGNLYTQKEYADFDYRFEFKLTAGANNGLGIRAPLKGDAAYAGMELQILDNTAPMYANLEEYQYHGSVYGIKAAKRGFLKPVGEWNKERVVVKGDHIRVYLNGTLITDCRLNKALKHGPKDKKKHPGALNKKGYIGFLGHGSRLWFRNIRIKDLSKEKPNL